MEAIISGLYQSWSVVAVLLWGSWYLSRALNALKNHHHDKDGVAFLREKIKL